MDYLLRNGYGESARALAREKGIEELVDLEVFVQCHKIEESLRRRSTQECLAWCAEHRPMMRKTSVKSFRPLSGDMKPLTLKTFRTTSNSNFGCSTILSFAAMDSFWRHDSMRKST